MADTVRRQERRAEIDNQRYHQEASEQLSKLTAITSSLRAENEKMKQDLSTKAGGGALAFMQQDKLASMQQEIDDLEIQVHREQLRKADIQKVRSEAQMQTMSTRRLMGGIDAASQNTAAVDRQMTVLENRLDQALVRFNEALSYNKQLRQRIDNLREERKVFLRIYKRLEADLHSRKKAMAEKIERANQNYEERDALLRKLEEVRQEAVQDQRKREEALLQLEVVMQQVKATHEQQLQLSRQLQAREQQRQAGAASSPTSRNATQTGFDERVRSTKRSGDGIDGAISDTAEPSSQKEDDEDIETTVRDLTTHTNCADLSQLIDRFRKDSDENYATYNYVNDMTTQIEELELEIAQLNRTLQDDAHKCDTEKRRALKELENRLAATETHLEQLTVATGRRRQLLTQIRGTLEDVFRRVGCSSELAMQRLGTVECTDLNVTSYLGLLEERANVLLYARMAALDSAGRSAVAAVDDDDDDASEERPTGASAAESPRRRLMIGPLSKPHVGEPLALVKPTALPNTNAGDVATDMDDAASGKEELLTIEEMRERVAQRMARRNDRDDKLKGARRRQSIKPKV